MSFFVGWWHQLQSRNKSTENRTDVFFCIFQEWKFPAHKRIGKDRLMGWKFPWVIHCLFSLEIEALLFSCHHTRGRTFLFCLWWSVWIKKIYTENQVIGIITYAIIMISWNQKDPRSNEFCVVHVGNTAKSWAGAGHVCEVKPLSPSPQNHSCLYWAFKFDSGDPSLLSIFYHILLRSYTPLSLGKRLV